MDAEQALNKKNYTLEISYTYLKNDFLLKEKVSFTFPHTSPSSLT